MGDAENALPPSKKRAAGRELSRDNPGLDDEEESNEQETGSFQRASDEVLANRRIVKVRRNAPSAAPSSNPFAGIRLVSSAAPAPSASAETKATADETKENQDEASAEIPPASEKTDPKSIESDARKETDGTGDTEEVKKEGTDKGEEKEEAEANVEDDANKGTEENTAEDGKQAGETITEPATDAAVDDSDGEKGNAVRMDDAARSDDKKESGGGKTEDEDSKDAASENAEKKTEGGSLSSFQQLSSSKNAFTGLAGTGFSSTSFSFGSGASGAASGSFSFGFSNNGNSSLFNASTTSIAAKTEGSSIPPMQAVQVETGEENERVAFSADSILFEFLDGGWKERGKGEVKVNASTAGPEKARLVMRAKGNYRLILNASIYPEMKLTDMDKRGITFACMNSINDGKEGLCTFALKFKDASVREEFRESVMAHKGKAATAAPKTPENSPKTGDV